MLITAKHWRRQDYKKLSEEFTKTLNSIPNDVFLKYAEPKQETLEEAAKEFVLSHDFSKLTNPNHLANRCFQFGAKYQAEKMYSEEEVKKLIIDFLFTKSIGREVGSVNEWFEQFKKK